MIVTNVRNLPMPFVDAAHSDYEYKPNEYRVTTLLKGVREILLTERHRDEITADASEMVWAIFGTAVHSILERGREGVNQIKENRLRETFGEYTISGQFDLYDADTATITDYKTCSVWRVVDGNYSEWERQMLIYGLMLRKAGFDVKRGQIVALMKDHSKSKAKRERDYPKYPVQIISFEWDFTDFEKIENYIRNKLAEIERYKNVPDDELPLCSLEERWAKPEKYAVMKKGRTKSLRNLPTYGEACAWQAEHGGDYIETRKARSPKCEEYCSCCEFCSFYNNEVKGSMA